MSTLEQRITELEADVTADSTILHRLISVMVKKGLITPQELLDSMSCSVMRPSSRWTGTTAAKAFAGECR